MMEFLLKLLVTLACESLTLWMFRGFNQNERGDIIELGYLSASKAHKKPDMTLPLWDRILHWSLCKEAKKFKASVWLYFSCNLLVVAAAIGSIILACVLLFSESIREVLLYQLTYMIVSVLVWAGIHLLLDAFFLPSEQERRGFRKKKKENDLFEGDKGTVLLSPPVSRISLKINTHPGSVSSQDLISQQLEECV